MQQTIELAEALTQALNANTPVWWDGSHLHKLGGKYEWRDGWHKIHGLSLDGVMRWFEPDSRYFRWNLACEVEYNKRQAQQKAEDEARQQANAKAHAEAQAERKRFTELANRIDAYIDDNRLKGTRQTYRLDHGETVTAMTYGHFGVRKSCGDYVVDHLPTGKRMPGSFRNATSVKRYVYAIEPVADWDNPSFDSAKICHYLKRFCNSEALSADQLGEIISMLNLTT